MVQNYRSGIIVADIPLEEAALVVLAKNGDRLAYAELYRRHAKRIYLTILRITKNREDAEDALQETLMKAFQYLRGFDGRSAFSTWLTRIAINSALIMSRKSRNRLELTIDHDGDSGTCGDMQIADGASSAEELVCVAERDHRIHRAIQRLPPKLREPLELQLSEDLSVKEVAKSLCISVAATKSRLLRARARLRGSVLDGTSWIRPGSRLRTQRQSAIRKTAVHPANSKT